MAAKKKSAGLTDTQIFKLKCPDCAEVLVTTNYRRGSLDRIRGIQHVERYGWFADCPKCERRWGSEEETSITPSCWVLIDEVQKQS